VVLLKLPFVNALTPTMAGAVVVMVPGPAVVVVVVVEVLVGIIGIIGGGGNGCATMLSKGDPFTTPCNTTIG
jgi:hypothetical protein